MRSTATVGMIALALSGCCGGAANCPCPPGYPTAPPVADALPATLHPNPICIPIADPQCAWEQIVDVIDDYFRIESEVPARIVGNVPTQGTLTTIPEVSPTIFEPWRHDTVDPPQRLENTLQTIRRQAVIHVTPVQGGQVVDVQVLKYLEDLKQPEYATAGAATFRYDSSLSRVVNPTTGEPTAMGWIWQGRDAALEQHIIGELLSRCGQAGGPAVIRGQSAGPAK